MAPQWFLELRSGMRVNLSRGLTSIGRSTRCDIVVPDPAISRRQALVCPHVDAVELINVGKQPLAIDGEPVTETGRARAGAAISIAGVALAVVRREQASRDPTVRMRWCVRVGGGALISLPDHHFTVGGHKDDDLVIAGWAKAALTFHVVDGGVVVEAAAVEGPGAPFDDDGLARLGSGEALTIDGVRFEVVAAGAPSLEQSTVAAPVGRIVIELEQFRSGGMVTVERGDESLSVYVAGRRYALLGALLAPTVEPTSGYLSVDDLCEVIWPDDPIKDRSDFNVLLYRLRRDLLDAGIDVDAWIERGRGSGMIRAPIRSAPGVEIRVDAAS